MTEASTKADQISSDSEAGMSDKDTVCYNKNYADVGGADKARDHYQSKGHEEGRQPNCGRSLTTYEEKYYLKRYGDLERAFGRNTNEAARKKAHQHFIDYGNFEERYPGPWNPRNKP